MQIQSIRHRWKSQAVMSRWRENQYNMDVVQPYWGDDYKVEFARDTIKAFSKFDIDKRRALREDVKAGVLTPNEAREELNLEPKEGGDDLLVKPMFVPIDQIADVEGDVTTRNTDGRDDEKLDQQRENRPERDRDNKNGKA